MQQETRRKMRARLKRARVATRMTQDEVAHEIGVTRQTLSSWERGTTSPSMEDLATLCALYGVSADLILYGEETVSFDASDLRAISRRQSLRRLTDGDRPLKLRSG